jgi:hypothetical protein
MGGYFLTIALPFLAISIVIADDKEASQADADALLRSARQLEVFSIDPDRAKRKPGEGFHDWKVLGSTTVRDERVVKKVVAAVFAAREKRGGDSYACFEPRHAIRVKQGDRVLDLLICFECLNYTFWDEQGRRSGVRYSDDSPAPILDRILKSAGVPLAEKPKKKE